MHRTLAEQGTVSFTWLAIDLNNAALSPEGRGKGEPPHIALEANCISPTGALGPPTRVELKLAFKSNGNVDYKTSDLKG